MTPPAGHCVTDLVGEAGKALFRLPWLHRILLENLLRRSPEALDVVPDLPASGAVTQELLGWVPTQPGLLADLDAGHYTAA